MNEFESDIWNEIEGQLCDVPLHLLDFATRQGIVDRLAPRVAAAINASAAVHTPCWPSAARDAGLLALSGGL